MSDDNFDGRILRGEEARRHLEDLARRFQEKGRELYEAGDKSEFMRCLYWCIRSDEPIPPWLKEALEQIMADRRSGKFKSWDEPFGKPLGNKHQATVRRDAKVIVPLFDRVQELSESGRAIDKKLFEDVGKEFGVGGTVASDLYYDALRAINIDDEDIINRR